MIEWRITMDNDNQNEESHKYFVVCLLPLGIEGGGRYLTDN